MTANFLLAVILACCVFANGSSPTTVVIPKGTLEGFINHIKDTNTSAVHDVHTFLGIHYAEAPIAHRRFSPPVAAKNWAGTRTVKEFGNWCMQDPSYIDDMKMFKFLHRNFSEDCLTLNVYTKDPTGNSPVLVFLHGGAWIFGMSGMADGTYMAAYQSIVVVTVNYRLGALGFLSTGDSNAPGNLGLLDQQMALQWVRNNIKHFGGNPSKITVSGQDAGAWSTTLHLISPTTKSRNLFRSAMTISGSGILPMLSTSNPKPTADALGAELGCHVQTPPEQLVSCLRNVKDASAIIKAQTTVSKKSGKWTWVATIDKSKSNSFLPDHPETLYEKLTMLPVPHLGIVNFEEGVVLALIGDREYLTKPYSYTKFTTGMNTVLSIDYPNNSDVTKDLVENFYLVNTMDKTDPSNFELMRQRFVCLLGSAQIDGPHIQTIRYHSEHENATAYLAVFNYRSSWVHWPDWVTGATFFEEQAHLWGYGLDPTHPVSHALSFNPTDINVSVKLMSYVAKFVNFSTPDYHLPKYTLLDEDYLDISSKPTRGKYFNTWSTNLWGGVVMEEALG